MIRRELLLKDALPARRQPLAVETRRHQTLVEDYHRQYRSSAHWQRWKPEELAYRSGSEAALHWCYCQLHEGYHLQYQ